MICGTERYWVIAKKRHPLYIIPKMPDFVCSLDTNNLSILAVTEDKNLKFLFCVSSGDQFTYHSLNVKE